MTARKRPPGRWRLGADHPDWTPDNHAGVGFDELVVDHWLHVEMMGDRDGWVGVGPLNINVHIDRAGRARIVSLDVEDDTWTEDGGPHWQRWRSPRDANPAAPLERDEECAG